MAEAVLELDISPALDAVATLGSSLEDIAGSFAEQLSASLSGMDVGGMTGLEGVGEGLRDVGKAGGEAKERRTQPK